MATIELAPEVLDECDRIIEHCMHYQDVHTASHIDDILQAIDVLATNPLIGRPANQGKRELVIGRKARGFLALYQYVEVIDTVFVLAVRSQREAGYER